MRCRLRQAMKGISKEREQAVTICERAGELRRGSEATGHRYGVSLNISCPHGYRALGLFHTHPGGTTNPSEADIREARRMGLHHLCIGVPETDELTCHQV